MLTKSLARFSLLCGLLALSLSLSELKAQSHAKAFPQGIDVLTLSVTEKGLNKLTMIPAGARTDNETRFIFSGHQKGNNLAAPLLGIPGLIVSSEINSNRGAKRLAQIDLNEANLVEEMALAALESVFEGSKINPMLEVTGSFVPRHSLQVSPYATLNQSKKNGTKLHAMLVISLHDSQAGEKPIWKSQFYGEVDGTLDETTLSNPDLLYKRLERAFERAAWGFARIALDDFDAYQPVTAKGWLAWFRNPGELPCIKLHANDDATLLRLPFGAIVAGAGYNVMSTQSLTTKPLKKLKDKFKSDFER